METNNLLQHFRQDETVFVQKAQQWINQAVNEYREILTPFLNPRERYILQVLVNHERGLNFLSNGVFLDAEMQRGLILPDYIDVSKIGAKDFELQLVEIEYPKKFVSLQHRTILGALMHNGIERNHVGDIVKDAAERWQFVTTPLVAKFLTEQVDRLGRVSIRFALVEDNQAIVSSVVWEQLDILVSSSRLDNVIAEAFHISRGDAKQLVETSAVRVNWMEQVHPDVKLSTGDLISIRRNGRLQIIADNGLTKKDKHKLAIARLKNR